MRIKGVPLEEAAPNVQQLYHKVAGRLGHRGNHRDRAFVKP
jgi:hypothetical protein